MTPKQFEKALTPLVIMSMRRVAGDISPQHAEDIAQDAAISAWLSCESFRGDCDFSGWILRITRNYALNYVKSAGRYRKRVMEDACDKATLAMIDNTCPFLKLAAERRLSLICDKLSGLKPAARDTFLKYRMTPAAYKDISGNLSNNKSRISRVTALLLEE